VFDDIYRKLDNELQQKKKEMATLIEQANSAYEARDQAQATMAALKQQADREHVEFEREWKELGKLIQNDKKMKEFIRSKVKAAKETSGELKDDFKSKTRSTRSAWDVTNRSLATISGSQDKVASFEEAFARIQAATNITNLEVLVHKFIQDENQNFSLFKFNNELSTEIEKLEQQVAEYKEELVRLSGSSSRRDDTEKVKLLETLDQKWIDIDTKTKKLRPQASGVAADARGRSPGHRGHVPTIRCRRLAPGWFGRELQRRRDSHRDRVKHVAVLGSNRTTDS